MKIIVSQKEKKLEVIFSVLTPIPGIFPSPSANSSIPGIRRKYTIAKAEDFLGVVDRVVKLWQSRQRRLKRRGRPKFYYPVDKFLRKRKISLISFIGQIGHIEFKNTSILTERIIRSIILGLCF